MFPHHRYGISIKPDPWNRSVQAVLWLFDPPGKTERMLGVQDETGAIEFQDHPDGAYVDSPTFSISEQDAQTIFDTLYNAGYRPNGGRDSAGVREAQQQHINDLRKVMDATLLKGRQE